MKNRTLDTYLSSPAPASQSCSPPSNQSSSASASTPFICNCNKLFPSTSSNGKLRTLCCKNFISYLWIHLLQSHVTFSLHPSLSIHHPSITHSLSIIAPVPSSYAVSCSTPTWWPTHPGPAIRNCPPSGSTTEQMNCQKFWHNQNHINLFFWIRLLCT